MDSYDRQKKALQLSSLAFLHQVQNEDLLTRHLYQEGVLTLEQFEQIHLPVHSRFTKIQELWPIVQRAIARPGVFPQLLTILRKTGSSKLAAIISDNYASPDPRNALWLDPAPLQKKALRSSIVTFVTDVHDEEVIIRRLYQQGCLKTDQFQRIHLPINTRTDKLCQLLCHVVRATNEQAGIFQQLLAVLRETGNDQTASLISNNYHAQ